MQPESGNFQAEQKNSSKVIRNYFAALQKLSELSLIPLCQEELLERFLDLLTELLQVEQAYVMVLEHITGELTIKASKGLKTAKVKKYRLNLGQGIAGQVLENREAFILNQSSKKTLSSLSAEEPDALLYIPLVIGYQPYGVIALGSAGVQRNFTANEVKTASALTQYLMLSMENARLNSEISGLGLNFLKSLAMAIDAKDNYTRMHSMRVTRYAVLTGVHMGLPQENIETLRRGALLHDIGKIGIRDDILQKPGKLTKKEYAMICEHPEIGARILGQEGPLSLIVPLVLHHHERYDGQGYPHRLRGTEIPLGARIIAVADAFEAMTANRPYRREYSVGRAVWEIRQNAGSQFDPETVAAFLDALKEEYPEEINI